MYYNVDLLIEELYWFLIKNFKLVYTFIKSIKYSKI